MFKFINLSIFVLLFTGCSFFNTSYSNISEAEFYELDKEFERDMETSKMEREELREHKKKDQKSLDKVKEEEVKKAHLDAGLEILEIHHQGDWVSITSRKN